MLFDNLICIQHIDEKQIQSYIRKNYTPGICKYCGQNRKVIKIGKIVEFMEIGINSFYEDAANFLSYNSREGGYLGTTYNSYELIVDLIELETDDFKVSEDIINLVEDKAWADRYLYQDDPADDQIFFWEYFKKIILEKSRFLFFDKFESKEFHSQRNASEILKEIGRNITELRLIDTIPKGTRLFRSRQHKENEKISNLDEIVAPPQKYAIYPNRFSPAGISMIYTALEKETAVAETINVSDKAKPIISTAEFETLENISIINFNKIPPLPSIFNISKVKKYYKILFLRSLVRDFTKGVSKDGLEHIEYIPTQVVTEYLRFVFNNRKKNKVQGLLYPSKKKNGGNAMVNFWNNEECQKKLKLINIEREKTNSYA